MSEHALSDPGFTRRDWLGGLIVLGLGSLGAGDPVRPIPSVIDPAELAKIKKRASEAKLKDFGTNESDHYLGAGDAPEKFRKEALYLCEELAVSFKTHFQLKGFEVPLPSKKMTVVTLKDKASYEAFKGEAVGEAEGGHYEVSTGRLVIFDFRESENQLNAKRTNTFILVHEAVHQLTYGTSILERGGDVPVAISEGFATYGELWRIARREKILGQINRPRLAVLKMPGEGRDWIPLDELISGDDLFYDPKTEQLAYAESWLLIYELFKTHASNAKLIAFLKAIKTRENAGKRIEDAEKTFGNLDRLDREMRRSASLLVRG